MKRRCPRCGDRLYRVHRTFAERFRYMAIFECKHCHTLEPSPRQWAMHLGPAARCPHCGTFRLTRLKEPDRIDRVGHGFLNLLERMAGGRLHHCRFCRIQFYDRRPLATELAEEPMEIIHRRDTASSGE